jgi:hypothetical protein
MKLWVDLNQLRLQLEQEMAEIKVDVEVAREKLATYEITKAIGGNVEDIAQETITII